MKNNIIIFLILSVICCGCKTHNYIQNDRFIVHNTLNEMALGSPSLQIRMAHRATLDEYPASFIMDVICNDTDELYFYPRIVGMGYVAERDFRAYCKAFPILFSDTSSKVRAAALAYIGQSVISSKELAMVENMLDDTSVVVRLYAARVILFANPDDTKLLDMVISYLATEEGWKDYVGDPPRFPWQIARLTLDELLRQKKIRPEYLFLKAKEYKEVNQTIYYHLIDVCTYVPSAPEFFETFIDFSNQKRLADLDDIFDRKINEMKQ